ncbi:hypothetical protein IFM89_016166 [Coptis chinensis]|uniref:Uncharacterized protein n=1 Tax=Coptis chinensis TaxID=261450 RepID=A0A835HHX5_9MAGN|nr:hypothetical protein IFM89_016166 [Coptis chinensis]
MQIPVDSIQLLTLLDEAPTVESTLIFSTPSFENLAGGSMILSCGSLMDVAGSAQTAFGSNCLEGQKIFDMLTKLASIVAANALKIKLPVIGIGGLRGLLVGGGVLHEGSILIGFFRSLGLKIRICELKCCNIAMRDEYDDSFDDLGLNVVESGFEDDENLGDRIKSAPMKSSGLEAESTTPNKNLVQDGTQGRDLSFM